MTADPAPNPTPPIPPAPSPPPPDDTLLDRPCPACGYDLRGIPPPSPDADPPPTPTPRCPECGLTITPDMLDPSAGSLAIPWASRSSLGHLRAFTRTLALVLRRPARLPRAMLHSVDPLHARRFATLCTLPCALLMASIVVLILNHIGPLGPSSLYQVPQGSLGEPLPDLFLPLLRTWTDAPVPASAAFTFLLFWLLPKSSATPMWLIRQKDPNAPHQKRTITQRALRAAALAPYSAAGLPPLIVGLLAVAFGIAITELRELSSVIDFGNKKIEVQQFIVPVGSLAAIWGTVILFGTPLLLAYRAGASYASLLLGAATALTCLLAAILAAAILTFWIPGYLLLARDVVLR